MDNPYASPPAVADSRPWFSGVAPWFKSFCKISGLCIGAIVLCSVAYIAANWGTIQAQQQPGTTFLGDEFGPPIDRVFRKWIDPPA